MELLTPDNCSLLRAQAITQSKKPSVFLAGTIANGDAPDWQQEAVDYLSSTLKDNDIYVINPRRNYFLPSMLPEQIKWEQYLLRYASYIIFNFVNGFQSPITLLELGICMETDKNLYINISKYSRQYQNIKDTLQFALCEAYITNDNLLQSLSNVTQDIKQGK